MTFRPFLQGLAQDVNYGVRRLRRSPVFTAVSLLTLALGVGANVAILTLVDAVLLRPLPYPQPDRLVEIDDIYEGRASGVEQDEFREWVATAGRFERLAIAEFDAAVMRAPRQPDAERIVGSRVSDGFFDVLGAKPLLGRTFLPGEDAAGRADVVVLSHLLWRRRFDADPNVVGTTITLGETSVLVIGVMPRSFFWIGSRSAEYWRPLGYRSTGRMQHQYSAVGRLGPGVSVTAAQAQMDVLARRAQERYVSAKGWSIRVRPLGWRAAAQARTPLVALATAVGLVPLIVCANLASLMTARTVSRSGETAVQAALGATRGRLIRQLLVESALLALIGGGLGMLLATWMLGAVLAIRVPGIEWPQSLALDSRPLVICAALVVLATTLFGLVPARRATGHVVRAIASGGAGRRIDIAQHRFLRRIVLGEVALATVLLIAATLLIASFSRLLSRDLGFDPEHLLTFEVRLPATRYDGPRRVAFFDELIERLHGVTGIERAAAVSALPMSGSYTGTGFDIEGRQTPVEWRQQSAQYCIVTAGYFRTMDVPMLRGREFVANESAPAVVISESLARRHWLGEDPVGRRIRERGKEWLTIIGVAADTRYGGPTREPNPTIYLPHELASPLSMFVAVRLRSPAHSTLPAVRAVVRQMDPALAVTRVATMDELTGRTLAVERLLAMFMTAFAVVAVALAAIGIYGVTAYSVQQRMREIGIRLALGAEAGQVRNMVLWHGLRATLAGVGAGIVLALAVTRFISSYLFGVTARDPVVFSTVPLVLAAVALVSVWLPADRAARVDPGEALRTE